MVERARRYVLWLVKCRRGRRCATLAVEKLVLSEALPDGRATVVEYTCPDCGTTFAARPGRRG